MQVSRLCILLMCAFESEFQSKSESKSVHDFWSPAHDTRLHNKQSSKWIPIQTYNQLISSFIYVLVVVLSSLEPPGDIIQLFHLPIFTTFLICIWIGCTLIKDVSLIKNIYLLSKLSRSASRWRETLKKWSHSPKYNIQFNSFAIPLPLLINQFWMVNTLKGQKKCCQSCTMQFILKEKSFCFHCHLPWNFRFAMRILVVLKTLLKCKVRKQIRKCTGRLFIAKQQKQWFP